MENDHLARSEATPIARDLYWEIGTSTASSGARDSIVIATRRLR
jgi:hypothetical protein